MREIKFRLRKLKAAVLIFVVTALTMSMPVAAQDARIALPNKKLSSREVFNLIQEQTNYQIAVNNTHTDNLSVRIGRSPVTVKEVLGQLFSGSNVSYRMADNYIIVTAAAGKRDAASAETAIVEVKTLRGVSGLVTDAAGAPIEGVKVEMIDHPAKRTATQANGRFTLEAVPAGQQVVKLTSADGRTVRFREITVPTGADATVAIELGGEIMEATANTQQVVEITPRDQATKATAYYVPNAQDNTIRAFSDEPKTQYSYIPSEEIGGEYMPKVAIKTNLLVWGTATPNAAVEFAMGRKWTMDIFTGFNPFQLEKGGINKISFIQPEVRYWFCQRFEKHFIGLHGIYGRFNVGDVTFLTRTFETHRYKGWGAGAGISYGYHLPMSKRWSWEFTVGAGYVYLEYDKYRCYDCDEFITRKNRHYFGPTKAGISLVFMIK